MNEVERIASQVDRAYLDGAWVTVSVRDLFRSLSVSEAAARPVSGAHSAWEIALHLAFWHDAVRRRLAGEVVDYGLDEDWPAAGEPTETSWQRTLDELDRSHRELVHSVRALKPEALDKLVQGRSFTIYFMLHGVPQHDLYHGGQVMMLKKAACQAAT